MEFSVRDYVSVTYTVEAGNLDEALEIAKFREETPDRRILEVSDMSDYSHHTHRSWSLTGGIATSRYETADKHTERRRRVHAGEKDEE